MSAVVHVGNVLDILPTLEAGSVNCVVTSPPYWGLRDYGTAQWDGGDAGCDHRPPDEAGATTKPSAGQREHAGRFAGPTCAKCGAIRVDSQLGLEPTHEEYVANMVAVFRDVRRILRDDGTLWLNLGDSYCADVRKGRAHMGIGKNAAHDVWFNRNPPGLKPKDLCMMPARVAMALQADGWWLRSEVVWAKPNGMPGSQEDRCTSAHEMVYMLTKSAHYWSDFDAIKTPPRESSLVRLAQWIQMQAGSHRANGGAKTNGPMKAVGGKQRGHGRRHDGFNDRWDAISKAEQQSAPVMMRDVWFVSPEPFREAHFAVMPSEIARRCIVAGCPAGGTVLDPFTGSGTTGAVACRLGRNFVGIELSPEYAEMAERRIAPHRDQMQLVVTT